MPNILEWAFQRMPVSLGTKPSVESFPVVVASDQGAFPVSIGRIYPAEALSLAYNNAIDPIAFIDVRAYAMFEIGPIPLEANGLTMTPLSADDAAGTGKAVPHFYDGITKTAMPGIVVATNDRIVIKAENAPIWFLGLRFSGAFTGTIPVRPKG